MILTIYLAYLAIALIGASDVDGIAYKLAYPFYGLVMAMLVPLATLAYYVASLMRRRRG